MKKKALYLLLVLLIVMAIILPSCKPAEAPATGGEKTSVTGTVTEKATGTTAVEEKKTTAAGPVMLRNTAGKMEEEPKYGGTITRAGATTLVGFDPAYTVTWQAFQMVYTHDPLMAGDWAKGPSGTGETGFLLYSFMLNTLTGYLAESYEFPDPETIIFNLRKGVRWQNLPPVNGREFVADDVVFSFKRLFATPESYLVTTHKPGLRPTSIEADGKYKVIIKVPAGNQGPLFRDLAAQTWPIAPEIVKTYGDHKNWKNVVGTGPFIMTDWVPQSSWTFTRNPNYWMTDPLLPGKKLPYVDGYKYLEIPDTSTRIAALRTGKIDMLDSIEWKDKANLTKTHPQLLFTTTGLSETGVGMRTDKAPFNDIRVRRALWLAMDNKAIKDDFYGGNAAMLNYPIKDLADFRAAYVPLEQLPASTQELYGYNPEKAKQLLKEAGYPSGFKANMVVWGIEQYIDLATILQDQWAKIGVTIDITPLEYGAYTSVMVRFQHTDMILADSLWTSSPDKCQTWATGQGRNLSIISDPYLDQAYSYIQENFLNPTLSFAKLKEVVPYILDKAWYIQPPNQMQSTFWWPYLKRYNGEYSLGYTKFWAFPRYTWIDQDLKFQQTGKR